MKKKKIDKKIIWICSAISGILIVILTVILMSTGIKNYGAYEMDIRVNTVNIEDEVGHYTLKFKTDGQNSTVDASHISSTIFVKKDILSYKEGSRFKKVKAKKNYSSIYNLIASIPLKNEILNEDNKKSYNPPVDEKKVNAILDALALGRTTKKSNDVFLTIQDGTLKEFSFAIDDVDDYKSINISISFEKLNKSDKIDSPKIYKELTDMVSIEELYIL